MQVHTFHQGVSLDVIKKSIKETEQGGTKLAAVRENCCVCGLGGQLVKVGVWGLSRMIYMGGGVQSRLAEVYFNDIKRVKYSISLTYTTGSVKAVSTSLSFAVVVLGYLWHRLPNVPSEHFVSEVMTCVSLHVC